MVKRIVVAGSRCFHDYALAENYINFCIRELYPRYTLVFLSGCCSGADMIGEQYAREHGFKVEYYPAQWERFGRFAGPIRNDEMAKNCDYVICFWDGKKQRNTINDKLCQEI